MNKVAKIKAITDAQGVAAALVDIFPRIMINMSRLGGSQSCHNLPLTPPQMRALYALDVEGKPMRMSALAEMLGVTQSTATDVTKRLMGLGYITKERLAHDERVVCVTLSAEGRRAIKDMRGEKYRQFLKICEALPDEERGRLLKSHELILEIYSAM